MNKVQQLINKALSTSSEQEAISCLTLARKQYSKEYVEVKQSNTINTLMAQKSKLNLTISRLEKTLKKQEEKCNSLFIEGYEKTKKLSLVEHSLKFYKRLTIFMFSMNIGLILTALVAAIK